MTDKSEAYFFFFCSDYKNVILGDLRFFFFLFKEKTI